MILFTVGLLILILLVVFIIAIAGVAGAGAVIIFSDVIVCAFILGWIIKTMLKKKK